LTLADEANKSSGFHSFTSREILMASEPAIASSTPDALGATFWRKTLDYLMLRRVRITAILFICLVAEDLWDREIPLNLLNFADYKVWIGLGLVGCGVLLRSWAAGTLHKRTELTTSGPYGLVRHPLYIGSLMMMLGFCTLVDDAENIWFVLGPMLALYVYRAIHEEKVLAAAFPDQWPAFAKRVPRFFPRKLPREPFASWKLSQWVKNREYRALSAALLGLVAIQIWQAVYRW
jgi:protein-S-isoprenylcysteine O-methyltransferase Ste14